MAKGKCEYLKCEYLRNPIGERCGKSIVKSFMINEKSLVGLCREHSKCEICGVRNVSRIYERYADRYKTRPQGYHILCNTKKCEKELTQSRQIDWILAI